MALGDDLKSEVGKIFSGRWETRDGNVVPESKNLNLANDAVKIDGTVLYADISGSTKLVDNQSDEFAAEVYKTYLYCAAKIIKSKDGEITAYDGDRVMAVFIGNSKNSSAVSCALKINHAVTKIINPAIEQYSKTSYRINHVVGIDTSKLFVARTGVRGANDLVWVGRAANYAAKLASLSTDYQTRITKEVYEDLSDGEKYSNSENMWESARWTAMSDMKIYRSAWMRSI